MFRRVRTLGSLLLALAACSLFPALSAPARAVQRASASRAPLLRLVRTMGGRPLLANGGFERAADQRAAGWEPFEGGYARVPGGRTGQSAIRCESADESGARGARQRVTLNQRAAAPLRVSGWSRAQSVSGSPSADYSIYVDLTYTDGTPLWGQTGNFDTDTHGWQHVAFTITPAKPVREITVYALFRRHRGAVWFDDVQVTEIPSPAGAILFDGRSVTRGTTRAAPPRRGRAAQGGDAGSERHTAGALTLAMARATGAISSLRLGGRECAAQRVPSGFMAQDVAAGSDYYGFERGACPELGLRLTSRVTARSGALEIEGTIADSRGRDRAVTLVFAVPVDARGWQWHDDLRRRRPIVSGEYSHTVPVGVGSTRTAARYPVAAITGADAGLAIGMAMDAPALCRLAYNAETRQLTIAYDFGLVPETRPKPGSAAFRFVLYAIPARDGFRGAAERYYALFPRQFACRSRQQGIWMPFTDVSRVQGWEDFGFRYHEGDNNVPFDDRAGILSFRYTEPMTWWMPMPRGTPRSYDSAIATLRGDMESADTRLSAMARATVASGSYDERGRYQLQLLNRPWNDGAVFSLNPSPYLQGEFTDARVHWSPAIRQRLYGPGARGTLDGEYLDSMEGYVTADLNFRREHFAFTRRPLTFAAESKRPAIWKALAVYELAEAMGRELHAMGKLLFANGVPDRYAFLCGPLDVAGTETDWLSNGRWQPMSDEELCFRRVMCAQKPYLFLMNTDFERFTPEYVERYFRRCLFYGMLPSMFSHNAAENPYWQNPRWYDRDRPLFKRYLPLIRQVAEAGWQPLTHAAASSPAIYVERFGPRPGGPTYLTVLNASENPIEAVLTLDTGSLGIARSVRLRELLSGKPLAVPGGQFRWSLDPEAVAVFALERP